MWNFLLPIRLNNENKVIIEDLFWRVFTQVSCKIQKNIIHDWIIGIF